MYGMYACYCMYAIVCMVGVVITFHMYGMHGIIDMYGRYGICSTEVVLSEYTGSKQEVDTVDT